MRTREDTEKLIYGISERGDQYFMKITIELLLDIRDLLNSTPKQPQEDI